MQTRRELSTVEVHNVRTIDESCEIASLGSLSETSRMFARVWRMAGKLPARQRARVGPSPRLRRCKI